MVSNIYRVKRAARAPIIWRGRRQHRDDPPAVRAKLEQHLYRKKAWDLWTCCAIDPHHFYRGDLDADSVIVDVGAYRGHVAMELYDLYGAHIHAFEPAGEFYRDLVRRFDGNERLHAYNYGLGKHDATLELSIDGSASTFELGATYRDDQPTTTAQIRDVAAAFEEIGLDHVDFMKINIEGGEFDLLDQLHDSGWLNRTRYLLIQFHEWYDKAELRRWRSRRQLKQHHAEVWSCPWIYELWCHKDDPPPTVSPEDLAAFKAALREQLAGGGGNATS